MDGRKRNMYIFVEEFQRIAYIGGRETKIYLLGLSGVGWMDLALGKVQ
jgi:hypothetical protein